MRKVTHWGIDIVSLKDSLFGKQREIYTVMIKLVAATMILTAVGFEKPTLLKIVAELL